MACHRSPGAGHISQQRLLVNDEMEIHPEEIRRLLAQQHPLHENLEVLADLAIVRVDAQLQLDCTLLLVDLQLRIRHRVVHPVMDVELMLVRLLHTTPPHIRLIRENQRRRDGAHGLSVALIVVADRTDDRGNVFGRYVHAVQDAKRHQRTGLRVIHTVDDISEIMHPRRGQRQIHRVLIEAQLLQNIRRPLTHHAHMREAVLREMQRLHRLVLLPDVGRHIVIRLHLGK